MSDARMEFVNAMRATREVAVPGQQINLDIVLRRAVIAFADATYAPPLSETLEEHRTALLREVGLVEA